MSGPLTVDRATGLAVGVRQVLSPHHDARPTGAAPELVIVHGISLPPDDYGGPWIDRLFTGHLPPSAHPYFETIAGRRVSAHVLVRRDGEPVQYVSFNARAWHAGASSHRGREACNDYSVGIELEGSDSVPYEPPQYETLARLILALRAAYPTLANAEVVGHSDVAPGRKTDPGDAFEWDRLRALI
ncbi:1,6-anhydro-N-acetylmuramyl-L-alanine amidase AmpD [bacterium]|nr:MAG: 1,6-anhydro-N-acetylmuramyl-L-alanine amidase AmpD [bacterium]